MKGEILSIETAKHIAELEKDVKKYKMIGKKYKYRNEKALYLLETLQDIIYLQPTNGNKENDIWLLEQLNGIKYCLKGEKDG